MFLLHPVHIDGADRRQRKQAPIKLFLLLLIHQSCCSCNCYFLIIFCFFLPYLAIGRVYLITVHASLIYLGGFIPEKFRPENKLYNLSLNEAKLPLFPCYLQFRGPPVL